MVKANNVMRDNRALRRQLAKLTEQLAKKNQEHISFKKMVFNAKEKYDKRMKACEEETEIMRRSMKNFATICREQRKNLKRLSKKLRKNQRKRAIRRVSSIVMGSIDV